MEVPLTVGDFIRRASSSYGDRTAVIDEPGVPGSLGTITYASFEARARGLALALDHAGVAVGDRVAIVSPNAARFLIAYFGVSGSGRILVPVNYRLTAGDVRYILEHSGASVVLVDPESLPLVDGVSGNGAGGWKRVVLDGTDDAEWFAEAPAGRQPVEWAGDESVTASINYTSGTTARPKGVQLTHRNLWLNAVTFGLHTAVTDRDVFLHTLPMFHCNGWGMPYVVTGMGVPHVVLRKIDGAEILRRVEAHGVTLLCGAPAVLAAVIDAAEVRRERGEPVPGEGRTRMVVAGAPPPSKTIERLEAIAGWEFIQIYGLTETSPLLTINRGRSEWDGLDNAERARRLSAAGTAAIGVRIRTDDTGEVLARSNNVFAGYWNQPDESAKALDGGWFHTGDEGHVEDDDYLVISDRKKDVIISGGENVSSVEVEDALYQHPAVSEVAVIGVPDDKWGETVKALVVCRSGTDVIDADLIAHCRSRLAHFKCPTSVEFRDELPRTATGKLQKFKLRSPYWEGQERRV
jgi:fatty-acyl-CoA synthase